MIQLYSINGKKLFLKDGFQVENWGQLKFSFPWVIQPALFSFYFGSGLLSIFFSLSFSLPPNLSLCFSFSFSTPMAQLDFSWNTLKKSIFQEFGISNMTRPNCFKWLWFFFWSLCNVLQFDAISSRSSAVWSIWETFLPVHESINLELDATFEVI